MVVTKDGVRNTLSSIFDPEIGINIVDLGLIYDIEPQADGKKVKVTFTLTTPACPVGPMFEQQIRDVVGDMEDVDEVETELVFSPPWDPREMASDEAKFELGIF